VSAVDFKVRNSFYFILDFFSSWIDFLRKLWGKGETKYSTKFATLFTALLLH